MKIGILDQMIKMQGENSTETIKNSVELCKLSESMGYHRYWVSEHHGSEVSVCPSPEIMIALLLSQTKFIEIGAGGILLNNYTAYKVVESFKLLNDIAPSRINLGIGSSFGGDLETLIKLHDGTIPKKEEFEIKLNSLINYLKENNLKEKINMWILGCSDKSNTLSQELDINYCYGYFLNDIVPKNIKTCNMIAVSVVCSEDPEKLKLMLRSQKIVDYYNHNHISLPFFPDPTKYSKSFDDFQLHSPLIYGNPKKVGEDIRKLAKKYQATNILVLSNIHSFEDKIESYRLIKNELG